MVNASKKESYSPSEIKVGVFTKKEAAQLIASGIKHIHSSSLGTNDPCVTTTKEIQSSYIAKQYPWEELTKVKQLIVSSSHNRQELIQQVLQDLAIPSHRDLLDRVKLVLEELITNAIYHSYFTSTGSEKYDRKSIVNLGESEKIRIKYAGGKQGVYLSVTDNGGSILFEHIANNFLRCYNKQNQIEDKASGAGLGLYMVFELVSHLKIVCLPQEKTTISCWLPSGRSFTPQYFSFNFFQEVLS